MKLIAPLIFASLLFALYIGNASASQLNWSLHNVTDVYEREVVSQANEKETQEFTECMRDERETDVSKTSCINDVFGDVHN